MAGERRAKIKEYIELHGEASLNELMELCGECSNMTLWRDLKRLEEEGVIRRVRGGAIAMRMLPAEVEGMYSQRATKNLEAKRAIARAAVEFVEEGRSIYFDAGSTIMSLALLLPDKHFTITTSGANIAVELSQRASCTAICVGGQVSGNTLSCSGPQAEAFLDGINIDLAVMATSGYTLGSGFTSGSVSEHQLKQKVIDKASRVIMLLDSTKIGLSLPYTFANMAKIDILITEAPLPLEIRQEAEAHGVQIIFPDN